MANEHRRTPIRVVIADDHPMVRAGTRACLAQEHDIVVVGEAGDGVTTLDLTRRCRPDVLLLDIHLPDISGLEVVRCIRAEHVPVAVLILTGYDEVGFVRPLMQYGIQGYLAKTASAMEIVTTVRAIAAGAPLLGPAKQRVADRELEEALTARELEVLLLIEDGQRNQEIADVLCLSLKTVEFHIRNLLAKLGARSRTEAIHKAREGGFIR